MKIYAKSLNEPESCSKTYYTVDAAKFVCALLVVAIHVSPLESYSHMLNYEIINYFGRLAVPFFFTASGYFLFRKTDLAEFDKTRALKYACRILRLYLIWTVIYLPWILREALNDANGILYGVTAAVRNFLITGSAQQLWYLNATVVAVIILTFFFSKKMRLRSVACIAFALYLIGLLGTSYFGVLKYLRNAEPVWLALQVIGETISTTRNGLFFALPFMTIGIIFSKRTIRIRMSIAVIGLYVSMVLLFIEVALAECKGWIRCYDMYLFLVPAVFFLFYIVTHIELNYSPVYSLLRQLSMLVFLLHIWVQKAWELLPGGVSKIRCCATF